MAVHQHDIRVDRRPGPRFGEVEDEPPIGELFRQLSNDASHLIRQEVALGKAELRETASALAKDATKIGVALTVAWLGALALVAFLIVGLGALVGSYWAAALIVAVVFLGAGAALGYSAISDLRDRELKPERTIESLQDDAQWAKREARSVKREWQSENGASNA